MELKPYQQQVINDLATYLERLQETKNIGDAFNDFWVNHPKTPLKPLLGDAIEPYKNNVPRVPHLCVKVPTAGGKTFIGCNAIKTIFDSFDIEKPKAVVWLVPSVTILEQTLKNLKDPTHPYRQKINAHFGNKVEVFDKATLLQGSGFNATTIREQLNIMVFSFDSLRAKNKEDRKVFQENGNLQSFEHLFGDETEVTLGSVIKYLNPLVIVDESHNAESELSVEMLKELNPCFILDLTATPRKNSNIISFIDALELKRENMVKLPVIVYNHQDKTEVVNSSLQLQKRLEEQAKEEEKKGGRYIRPIVLFQAQPKNGKNFQNEEEEKLSVQNLKEKLLQLQIPEAQIKIKTANINEIKGIDLMSRACEVRFIITINALKEGWDCPFAYILASLADRHSAVDVEQILGRVLRQPYVMKHNFPLMNLCYVLTASSKFLDTLNNIVKGLNKAGFSEKDYKVAESSEVPQASAQPKQPQPEFEFGFEDLTGPHGKSTETNVSPGTETNEPESDIDVKRIEDFKVGDAPTPIVSEIEQAALEQTEKYEKVVSELDESSNSALPHEIQKQVKTYPIKEIFQAEAREIQLPQFYIEVPSAELFGIGNKPILLEKEHLLEGFALGKADTNIVFNDVVSELYRIDLDESKKEHTPTFIRIDGEVKERFLTYMLDPTRKDSRVKNLTNSIISTMGSMYPIDDKEIKRYIGRILEDFNDEQFGDFLSNFHSYTGKIKNKIKELSDAYAEKKFKEHLDTGKKIFIQPSYKLPESVAPSSLTSTGIPKSLYEKEGQMNDFEARVINEIGNMPNVKFWTRNIERRGFKINGFINHYPDFIIHTNSGVTVILETKGDHLDAASKIELGKAWVAKAGHLYRYFMVYDKRNVNDALNLEEFIHRMKAI